jgi:peptidoglycan/xylan/chitin deacetylase (PgdA/CDA1 family)
MGTGTFIISLDFELYWGVRDTRGLESYSNSILGVREAIPAMLDLFDKYDIKATFATVGFLFCSEKEELVKSIPAEIPQYSNPILSPYGNYLNKVGKDESEDPFHFGASLIKMIMDRNKHEIATHTFSHYYCLEEGQTTKQFREDIIAAGKVARLLGINNKSIVFPRNQYNDEYLKVCLGEGLIVFRGNEQSWIYEPRNRKSESQLRRIFRLLDSYVNISGLHIHTPESVNGLCNIPSSRFLRPYNPKFRKLDVLKLNRIKKQMSAAAKQKKIFHLWWHPHNFGSHLNENLSFLEKVLKHYKLLNQSKKFISMTMQETASGFLKKSI